MVFLFVFFFDAPEHTVGGHLPGMFLGVCAAWFSVALISVTSIPQR